MNSGRRSGALGVGTSSPCGPVPPEAEALSKACSRAKCRAAVGGGVTVLACPVGSRQRRRDLPLRPRCRAPLVRGEFGDLGLLGSVSEVPRWASHSLRVPSPAPMGRKGDFAAFGCSHSAGGIDAYPIRRPMPRRPVRASLFRADRSLISATAGRRLQAAPDIHPLNPNGCSQSGAVDHPAAVGVSRWPLPGFPWGR